MAKYDYDLIVIGGGAGGLTAALGAGPLGAKTLLIEKEEKLGGDCLHYGCVPSKALIKSAFAYHTIKSSEKYGLPKADIAPVDFAQVRERIRGIIDEIQKHDDPEPIKKKYNVDTLFGAPRFVDPHVIELNGKKITGSKIILATGSSPAVPPVAGLDGVNYITNVNVFSLDKLPRQLVVLGGGPIGVELAQAFSRLGSQVTVVEAADQLLPKEDADVAVLIQEILQREGIKVLVNAKAVRASQTGEIISLSIDQKGHQDIIEGDCLLVCVGRRPNLEGLALDNIGVACTKQGIKVDSRMRTSIKNIFACGDVAGGLQFTHVASYEASIALMNAVARLPLKADYQKIPWITFTDPEVASIGYNEQRAREAGKNFSVYKYPVAKNDRAKAEGETEGFIKILRDKRNKVIGVQIVAHHAGDLLHEWVAAMSGNVGLAKLAQAVHPYPTMAEISKIASANILAPQLFNDTVRGILKFLFGLQGQLTEDQRKSDLI